MTTCPACGSTQRESRRAVPTLNEYEMVPCEDRWHEGKDADRMSEQTRSNLNPDAVKALRSWPMTDLRGLPLSSTLSRTERVVLLNDVLALCAPAQPSGATAPQEAEKIGDLLAYGESERESARKAKDREQYQFWSGWVSALQRCVPVSRLTPEASSASAQETGEVLQVVPPFQHPGYVVRRAVPRPLADTDDESADSTAPSPAPSGEWWGVIGPRGMPCLYGKHREDAEPDTDERVALFRVEEVALVAQTMKEKS